jgi:hypothetical protein
MAYHIRMPNSPIISEQVLLEKLGPAPTSCEHMADTGGLHRKAGRPTYPLGGSRKEGIRVNIGAQGPLPTKQSSPPSARILRLRQPTAESVQRATNPETQKKETLGNSQPSGRRGRQLTTNRGKATNKYAKRTWFRIRGKASFARRTVAKNAQDNLPRG